MSPAAGAEIRRLAEHGVSHREIAKRVGVSRYRALTYMRDHGLIPAAHRKNRPVHKAQELRLPVNVQRVRLPDVNEDDVKLAESVWREFGRA